MSEKGNNGMLCQRHPFGRILEYWNNGKKLLSSFHHSIIPSFLCTGILFAAVFALSGCFTGGPGMMGPGNTGNVRENTFPIGNLETLWNERTIRLTPASGGLGGAQEGMRGLFPLNASATLIDSTLMNAGLQEFALLADIKEQDKGSYAVRYKEINKPDEYLFVWLELRTSYSKDLLNLDKWSIFLEDDKGNQYDPKNIVEYPEKDLPKVDTPNRRSSTERNNTWQMSSKILQLYFPKKRFDGSLLISPDVKSIKLVMFNWSNNARYEGKWYTNPNETSSLLSEKSDKL